MAQHPLLQGEIAPDLVGYAQKKLQQGSTMTAATFVPVSDDGVSIQQILPTGDNIEYGDINIQTLDAFGGTVDTYTYYGAEEYNEGSAAGWYTDNGLADAAFATGTGLWVAGLDGSAPW